MREKESKTEERKSKSKSKSSDSKRDYKSIVAAIKETPNITLDSEGRLAGCWICGSTEHLAYEKDEKTGCRVCKQDPKNPTQAGKDARKAFNESKSKWGNMPSAKECRGQSTSHSHSQTCGHHQVHQEVCESKSKDKKKEDNKPASDGKGSGEASVKGTMVNKDEFEAKHNATTEKNHKNKWDSGNRLC